MADNAKPVTLASEATPAEVTSGEVTRVDAAIALALTPRVRRWPTCFDSGRRSEHSEGVASRN
jgi:hypothetical protein